MLVHKCVSFLDLHTYCRTQLSINPTMHQLVKSEVTRSQSGARTVEVIKFSELQVSLHQSVCVCKCEQWDGTTHTPTRLKPTNAERVEEQEWAEPQASAPALIGEY